MLRFVKVAPEARLHYLDLLLIGDEDPNMLRRYLDAGTLFAAIDETVPVGVAMVVPVDATTIELKNLAVLPARLKDEMAELADALVNGTDLRATETLASHAEWAEGFLPKYDKITKDNVMDILHEEIGLVFNEVLQDAGVYECTPEGRKAFERFIAAV